jgi:peptide/nickel transport system substrate-binding protein
MYDRRSFLRLAATGTVVAALPWTGLVACSTPREEDAATGEPRTGGTLSYAVAVKPDSWDPHVSPADVVGTVLRHVFDSLVAVRPDGTFAPWLAASWTVSPDGLVYTFRLREDVTFGDGERFTAQAVKDNLDHVVAPATTSRLAGVLIGPYDRTEVVSEFTAAVHLKSPHSSFLRSMSTTYLGFHSPKSLREHADDLNAGGEFTVGTGPFRFTANVPGQQATFQRRPDYAWAPATAGHQGPAYLDTVVVNILTEDSSRVGAVVSGQIDIADQLPADRLVSLRADRNLRVARTETPGAPYSFYLNTERAPLNDVNARRAVRAAIDVETIVKGVFQGEYRRAWAPLTPTNVAYDKSLESSWGYDPAKANELLDQLGYTGRDADGYRTRNGTRFRIESPYVQTFVSAGNQALSVAVQDALKKVGIDFVLTPLDTGNTQGRTRTGNYDVFSFSWSDADPALLRNLFHSSKQFADGGANGARVRDPQLDEWLDRARASTDQHELTDLYQKVQRRVVDQAYSVPFYSQVRDTAVRTRVGGLSYDPQARPRLYDTWVSGAR